MNNIENFKYCNSLTEYSRLETREVFIGSLPLGGKNPIRIQSMTNTDTMNTEKTVAQCIEIIEAGADYVRITAPRPMDSENLLNIQNKLREKGCETPLIADIHFNPKAAETAAKIVAKVRINPGNYIDKHNETKIEYTDEEYQIELAKIRERLLPLIEICKENKTAIRIGTNHGSLSTRILSRYGDTPQGMVEATMEFLRIFVQENFHSIVISLKASNTRIMVHSTRLLVKKMKEESMNFPLHLGVTEAGDGEDGRIKSAVGIGTLLADGIGDTIRVSLTEDPAKEIPVARKIVNYFSNRQNNIKTPKIIPNKSPFEYQRHQTRKVKNIGNIELPVVIADVSAQIVNGQVIEKIGFKYDNSSEKWSKTDLAPDYIYTGMQTIKLKSSAGLSIIVDADVWSSKSGFYPIFSFDDFTNSIQKSSELNFVRTNRQNLDQDLSKLKANKSVVLIAESKECTGFAYERALFFQLEELKIDIPVILHRNYNETENEDFQIKSACDLGTLLIDGYGDGIWLNNDNEDFKIENIISTSFNILQASRVRQSKTEYISCPSCGRTLFDLQEVTANIKSKTSHLKGLKIGIMGCIVNGPGEMADADYGYVGTGLGKVTLYKQKEIIKRNISSDKAVNELITLIKQNGDWNEIEKK